MIFQSANNNCVMSAISIVRKSLGYKTDFEIGIPTQSPTELTYLIKYHAKFFPRHKVELYLNNESQRLLIKDNYLTIENIFPTLEDFFKRESGNSNTICIFDYFTEPYKMSHTVIGHPSLFRGMYCQYILRVLIDYQLELGL